MTVTADHLAWYTARAAGMTSWALLSLAVLVGLALSTRVAGVRPAPSWLLSLHRFCGGLSVVFVGVHLVALAADSYVPFGWKETLIPLTSHYRPSAVAAGIVAFYLMLAIEMTSLLMRKMPRRVWRLIHSGSFMLFVLATGHGLTAGTDGRTAPVHDATLAVLTVFVFLVVYRWLAPARGARRGRERHTGSVGRTPALVPSEPRPRVEAAS